MSADEIRALRADIDALRRQVAELRSVMPAPISSDAVDAVFGHWAREYQVLLGRKTHVKITPNRRAKIEARLRDGYTVQQLCDVLSAVMRDPWYTSRGLVDITHVCHSQERVDRWLAIAPSADTRQTDIFDRIATEVPHDEF